LIRLAAGRPTPAPLEIITNAKPQAVFGGGANEISITFHNSGLQDLAGEIRARMLEASSATVIVLSEHPWKRLEVPAGETVMDAAVLDFPAVKAKTKFLIQWLADSKRVLGQTEVLVYPTNLLAELKPLAGDGPVGVYDPQGQIKLLLKKLKLDFIDLQIADVESFPGKLAIFGPFRAKAQMREGLPRQIQALAKKNRAIVWIQPPWPDNKKLPPSFYSIIQNSNAVVIVQPGLLVNLPDSPEAQLNLIYFCRQALQPRPLALPDWTGCPQSTNEL
jgi:hypothetical protein